MVPLRESLRIFQENFLCTAFDWEILAKIESKSIFSPLHFPQIDYDKCSLVLEDDHFFQGRWIRGARSRSLLLLSR